MGIHIYIENNDWDNGYKFSRIEEIIEMIEKNIKKQNLYLLSQKTTIIQLNIKHYVERECLKKVFYNHSDEV